MRKQRLLPFPMKEKTSLAKTAFHTLDSGSAYLQVTDHSGTSTVWLKRQITWSLDKSYGSVYVNSNKTYKFPDKADTHSTRYYLRVKGSSRTEYAEGKLHN